MPDQGQKKYPRSLTTRNLLETKDGPALKVTDPELKAVIGDAERSNCWIIYGNQKHGKTSLALRIAKDLALHERVVYVSAEEGTRKTFRAAVKRAGILMGDKIKWDLYLPFDELIEKYKQPRAANVIIVDNMTIYESEIDKKTIMSKIGELGNKLIIFIAHEDRGNPSTPAARLVEKMSDLTIKVKGLIGFVTSRYPGGGSGTIAIDEDVKERLGV